MRNKAFVTYFNVLSQHLPGGTEENNEKSLSGYQIFGPRFEIGTSLLQCRTDKQLTHDIRLGY